MEFAPRRKCAANGRPVARRIERHPRVRQRRILDQMICRRGRPRPRNDMGSQTTYGFKQLSVESGAPAARITLRNSSLNIIDITMMGEISAALAEIELRPEISVIIFSGAGNVSPPESMSPHTLQTKWHPCWRNFMQSFAL